MMIERSLNTHIRSAAAVEPGPGYAQFVATDFVAGNLSYEIVTETVVTCKARQYQFNIRRFQFNKSPVVALPPLRYRNFSRCRNLFQLLSF
jgi:hypothetical protein